MTPFCFNDTATTEIYTLSLHDALPICRSSARRWSVSEQGGGACRCPGCAGSRGDSTIPGTSEPEIRVRRSEEHTSELQSRQYLVCRLLLEKKKKMTVSNLYVKTYGLTV